MTAPLPQPPTAGRSRFGRLIGPAGSLFALGIFGAAMWVLYRELQNYSFTDIASSMAKLGYWQIAMSLVLATLSYTLLTGYDWLAVHYIGRKLPYRQVALTSFVSYVCGYNFGAILGGSTMRYRLYSTFGLSALETVKVMAFCTLTFSLGYGMLAGAAFVFDPLPLPEALTRGLPESLVVTSVFPIGVLLLCGVLLYGIVSAAWHRPLRIHGVSLELPSPRYTIAQIIIAAADEAVAAGVLYVLLPAEIAIPFSMFLGIFLLAQIAGIASHVPGGLGVIELVFLWMLQPNDRAALAASLVVYRLVYYLLPLALAMILIAVHEVSQHHGLRSAIALLFGRNGQRGAEATTDASTKIAAATREPPLAKQSTHERRW